MWLAMGIFGINIFMFFCSIIALIMFLFIKNETICKCILFAYIILTILAFESLSSAVHHANSYNSQFLDAFKMYNIPSLLMLLIYFGKFPQKDFIKTIMFFTTPIIILLMLVLFSTIYNNSLPILTAMTAITNGKIYTLNLVTNKYQKPPIILNSGNSLWLNEENLEFYDYSKKKSFLIPKPDSTINFPTLLPDNKVLFLGDVKSYLFDTKTLTFTKTGDLKNKIGDHTSSIAMPSNKILFIDNSGTKLQIFDEKTGNFYSTSKPMLTMWNQQGIVLKNNKLLLYGGYKEGKEYYKKFQIYDVSTNKFYLPKNQPIQAEEIYPLLLKTGKVLILERIKQYHTLGDGRKTYNNIYQAYQIYDPISNTFSTLTNNYGKNREYPDLTLLNDGSVLIISRNKIEWRLEQEIFYTESQTFKQIGHERNTYSYFSIHSKATLKDGRVMLLRDNTIVLYDPKSQLFEELGHTRKGNSEFVPLDNGEMLIYGGDYGYDTNGHVTIEVLNTNKLKVKK